MCRETRTIFFGTARPITYINWSRSVNICVNWMLLELPRLDTSSLPAITNINVVVIWTHEVRTELDSIIVESCRVSVRWNMCTDRRKNFHYWWIWWKWKIATWETFRFSDHKWWTTLACYINLYGDIHSYVVTATLENPKCISPTTGRPLLFSFQLKCITHVKWNVTNTSHRLHDGWPRLFPNIITSSWTCFLPSGVNRKNHLLSVIFIN